MWVLVLLLLPLARAGEVSGAVGIVSDKLSRGVSSTEGRAAWQADLGYRSDDGWGAALQWAATLERTDPADEATLGLDRAWPIADDAVVRLGLAHYAYGGNATRRRYRRDEISASATWQGRWSASLAVSPNTRSFTATGLRKGVAWAGEVGLRQRLVGRWAVDAGVGYERMPVRDIRGHAYGSAGLSWGVGPVQAYLARVSAPAAAQGSASGRPAGGDRWAASLLWSF